MSGWRDGGVASIAAHRIGALLAADRPRVVDAVADAYAAHYDGACVNPDTYSLKMPAKPGVRINALPAYLGGARDLPGLKWVASFPGNVAEGFVRATATIILNCGRTGYPAAVLDGTAISAARTAASAALAARLMRPERISRRARVYGAGPIAAEILLFLRDDGWTFETIEIVDTDRTRARAFGAALGDEGVPVRAAGDRDGSPAPRADLIVFATSALEPWFDEPLDADQVVLHVSLRDVRPERLLERRNFVDDIDHALKAGTSLHRLEETHGRGFFVESFAGLIDGATAPGGGVAAAFGMGILDLAVADLVLGLAHASGEIERLDRWFPSPHGRTRPQDAPLGDTP